MSFSIQKRLSLTIVSIGMIMCILNIIQGAMAGNTVFQILIHPSVSILSSFLVLFLVLGLIDRAWTRFIQVIMGYFISFFTIMDEYTSIFGIGLFLVFSIIGFKYGLFEKRPKIKLFFGIVAVYFCIVYSAYMSELPDAVPTAINSLLYISSFLIIVYMIYLDEIRTYIQKTMEAEESMAELLSQRVELENKLIDLNRKIDNYNSRTEKIDFEELGITNREQEVIWALVVYQDKQKDIAERLNISPETVKTHLKHIRDKLGVDRQTEIIEMCRNNFLMEDKKT